MRHITPTLTACPACNSHEIGCVLGTDLDICMACHRCWERLRPQDPFLVDGEMLPFKTPCDNCAFRGKSEERQDRERWGELQQTLALGGEFYCHKGVPMKASVEEIAAGAPDSRMAFDFPMQTRSVDIEGKCHPYQTYDRERMRPCRGYLNAFVLPLIREISRHAETINHETSGRNQGVDRLEA